MYTDVFLQFIGILRDKYLSANAGRDYTFHSVILVGVYDIRNLKLKLINERRYTPTATEGKLHNSPWNIAAPFTVDMSFNPTEIATMLRSYENDYIELKLWRGKAAHEEAYAQLAAYVRDRGASEGCLLSFDFRREAQDNADWVEKDGIRIFDVIA